MCQIERLIQEMTLYEAGFPHRVHHFLKVHNFARTIGLLEHIQGEVLEILETAAVVHDIGILPSMQKYGDAQGKHQEEEGAPVARQMLKRLDYPKRIIERVAYLVGRHHTYTNIDGMDCQILIEADFLVNTFEDQFSERAKLEALENIFRTESGKMFYKSIYFK